jgi:hypothetical protein
VSWAKLDDQLLAHRKAKIAWNAHRGSLALHLLALSYCAGHLTDGLVDDEFVQEKLPKTRERDAITRGLEDAGLWTRTENGWLINDWLDYNPSRNDVLERRRKDLERKQRKDSARNPDGFQADSAKIPSDPSRARAFPDPTRPDPIPPSPPRAGGRKRDRDRFDEQLTAFAAEHFPGVAVGLVGHGLSELRSRNIEPTPDALRPWIDRWADAR